MLAKLCQFGIRLYWRFVPKEKRIVCLYKDHCSQHIFNAFESGFIVGATALIKRYKNCNNNYTFFIDKGVLKIKTSTGDMITGTEISDPVARGCLAVLEQEKNPL